MTMFRAKSSIGSIDKEAGVLKGVSILTVGEAEGHEQFVDDKMVRQVVKAGKETGDIGLKARFGHPNMCSDGLGKEVGRFKNFRKDGNKARADLHLLKSAADSPHGDLRKFILNLADEDPSMFATSIVFIEAEPQSFSAGEGDDPESPEFAFPHARIKALTGTDIVDEGAANTGLFSDNSYLIENIKGFALKNKDLLTEALTPIINQINTKMEDKTILQKVKKALGLKESDEAKEVTKLKEQLEAANAEVITYKEAAEATEEKVEEVVEEVEEKEEELEKKDTTIQELTSAINTLKEKVEALSKVHLGETVVEAPAGEEQTPADTTEAKVVKHTGEAARIEKRLAKRAKINALLNKEDKED